MIDQNGRPLSPTNASLTPRRESFSGADYRFVFVMPDGIEKQARAREMTEIQTVSVSTHRGTTPVRGLGHVGVKGYARGSRTVAGSIVMTVFDRHPLYDLLRQRPQYLEPNTHTPADQGDLSYLLPDQMPPFDLMIFANSEYGVSARRFIYGVEIASEGTVTSSHNMITEVTFQFTAALATTLAPGSYKDPNESIESYTEGQVGKLQLTLGRDTPRTPRSLLNSKRTSRIDRLVQAHRFHVKLNPIQR